eukprot:scaffold503_cov375-Pinguiococcus_pyrenoidosus.AAC.2
MVPSRSISLTCTKTRTPRPRAKGARNLAQACLRNLIRQRRGSRRKHPPQVLGDVHRPGQLGCEERGEEAGHQKAMNDSRLVFRDLAPQVERILCACGHVLVQVDRIHVASDLSKLPHVVIVEDSSARRPVTLRCKALRRRDIGTS